MFDWFKRKVKNSRGLIALDMETGRTRPITPLNVLTCTYCGGHDFYEGPSGGLSTNVLCANPKCRHWFNTCPMIGMFDDLHKVEPEQS